MEATCRLWVTLISEMHIPRIIAGLVAKGYTVGALASTKKLSQNTKYSALLSLTVGGTGTTFKDGNETPPHSQVLDDTREIVRGLKASCFGYICTRGGEVVWAGGDVFEEPTPPPQPAGAAALLSDEEEIG